MLLEEVTEGESYVDSQHEKVVPKTRSTGDALDNLAINGRQQRVGGRRGSLRGTEKASVTKNSRSFTKMSTTTTSSSSSSTVHLPRLVNSNNNNNNINNLNAIARDAQRANKMWMIGGQRFPEMNILDNIDAEDCPLCNNHTSKKGDSSDHHKPATEESKTSNKGVSFVVGFDSPKHSAVKKVESQPTLSSTAQEQQAEQQQQPQPSRSKQTKTPAPPSQPPSRLKSGGATLRRNGPPPSSLAAPYVTETKEPPSKMTFTEVAESDDKAPYDTSQSSQIAAKSEIKPVPQSMLPAISVPSGANATPRHIVDPIKPPEPQIRGAVLPSPKAAIEVRNISQPPPSFVVPPKLLAGLGPRVQCAPLSVEEAIRLKILVFGSQFRKPTDAWRLQSYAFNPENNSSGSFSSSAPRFVIIQRPNTGSGTVGALAVVQAELLRHILYAGGSNTVEHKQTTKSIDPFNVLRLLSRSERSDALGAALAEIISRAATSPKSPFVRRGASSASSLEGVQQAAKIVIPCGRRVLPSDGSVSDDGITEKLLVFTFPVVGDSATLAKELRSFFRQHLVHFDTDGSGGVLLTLYSAVLSRGIDTIYADFDESTCSSLISADAYTSSEALTLLLTGIASSYFFNDDLYATVSSSSSSSTTPSMLSPTSSLSPLMANESGGSDSGALSFDEVSQTVPSVRHLRGIHRRCDIGLLTLSEYQSSSAAAPNVDEQDKKQLIEKMLHSKTKSQNKLQNKVIPSPSDEAEKQLKEKMTKVGSYLKTPRFPIWVAAISPNSTRYAVLYSTNIELVSNWRAERLFDLFCLDAWLIAGDKQLTAPVISLSSCLQPMRLRLDAIDRPDLQKNGSNAHNGVIFRWKDDSSDDEDSPADGFGGSSLQKPSPPAIELVLQTKWPGAVVDYLQLPSG